jgi:heat shock protein HtpX
VNLLEQQAANRRRTWIVMGAFIAFLACIGAGVDFFVVANGEVFVPVATPIALAFGSGRAYWSLRHGDRSVLRATSAEPIAEVLNRAATETARFRYRQLQNVVDEMAIASGLPAPKTYVIPDPDPNAFATGRDPEHASIAVTEGLLERLNRDELQGVVAHEMAHIRNLDIRLMTVVAALVGAILLLSEWAIRAMRFGGGSRRSSSRDKNGGGGALALVFLVIWLLAIVLAPALGRLLALSVSRAREYLADATAAELTRNPLGLANALEKIEGVRGPTAAIKRGEAHLCIADPLERRLDNREGRWANLWATHPPMAKRIALLKQMAYVART